MTLLSNKVTFRGIGLGLQNINLGGGYTIQVKTEFHHLYRIKINRKASLVTFKTGGHSVVR